MVEEPENHLTHNNLNLLVAHIKSRCKDKQAIVSTHSSFVANKLGLNNIIVLGPDAKNFKLSDLREETFDFFQKLSGYDTLRLILSGIVVLVEGPSDELIFQKAYMERCKKLPIENGVDVISVGTSFLRFLEIAEKISTKVIVITDNDGNIEALKKKYNRYLNVDETPVKKIHIFFDQETHRVNDQKYNWNTLEPNLVRANDIEIMQKILGREDIRDDLVGYMIKNKTESALKIFNSNLKIEYPNYITLAVEEALKNE